MGEIGYIRMEETRRISAEGESGAVVYAPLGETPVAPSVVWPWVHRAVS
jgi:hypothetical protein